MQDIQSILQLTEELLTVVLLTVQIVKVLSRKTKKKEKNIRFNKR